jgi:hypothetical protein
MSPANVAIVAGSARRVRARLPRSSLRCALPAVLVGVLVLVTTGWIAAALGTGVLIGWWSRLFPSAGLRAAPIDRLEGIACWVEAVRDLTSAGAALPQALTASLTAAPTLGPSLQTLADRLDERGPLDEALLSLAEQWADPTGDMVALTLAAHTQLGGRRLATVLSSLAAAIRAEVTRRRDADAEQASIRRGTKIVLTAIVLTVAAMRLASPSYLAFYSSGSGQCVLSVVVAVFLVAVLWMSRLAAFPAQPRLLAPPDGPTTERR